MYGHLVVWADWFDAHKCSYKPALVAGLKEHALPGSLKLSTFLKPECSDIPEA